MFVLAILIGIYSYLIFGLGILGILYKENIIFLTVIFFLVLAINLPRTQNAGTVKSWVRGLLRCFKTFKEIHKLSIIFLALLCLQAFVNLIGALGPELGFDALWYHLTLPKIYLINHSIEYIPGGLLYYSTMPKLAEMLYVVGLAFGNEILAKFIHFSFGILSLIALYKLSRKFFSIKWALLVCVIFYSNLVVGWLSTSAYIDLARTFFEIMALWGIVNWREKRDKKWFILSAIMLGLAISTKLLAIGSLFIFSFLIIYFSIRKLKFKWKSLFTNILVYWWYSLLIPLPWFVFSYINTGNPVYPFLTSIYSVNVSIELINPIKFINDIWTLFTKSADPISPIYIIFLPVALFLYKKFPSKIKVIYAYSFLAILIWYITPRTGGGRFVLPYLPAFSMLSVWVIREIWKLKIRPIILGFVIFFSLFSLIYRFGATLKYIPVIIGVQSKSDFLTKNLNFSFGDFYDIDGFFAKNIKEDDRVLLYGFHNLYYVNFPFIDSSWVKKGDKFNYVAVQNANLSEKFSYWNQIYYNPVTNVKLYSQGGQKWAY